MKLALQVSQGDVEIPDGHVRRLMAKQFHEDRKANAGAKHLRGVSVSELMRNDARGDAHGRSHLVKVAAQLTDQGFLRAWARQQQAIIWQGIKRAEEADTLDKFT